MDQSQPQKVLAAKTRMLLGEQSFVEVFSRIPDFALRSVPLGGMEVIFLRCGSIAARRTEADIGGRPERFSTFIMQLRGRSCFEHYGHRITLNAGDLTLCDNSVPYELAIEERSEIVMLRLPTALIRETIPAPDGFYGLRLPADFSLVSTATAIAADLSTKDPAKLGSDACERAARHLVDVLATTYLDAFDADGAASSSVMAVRHWRVKLYVEKHLRDPSLSPSLIAERLKLSDRYLRMIFAVAQESPSVYILRRRLEECARQLRDPRWRGRSITDIAFGWGFNSPQHFARSFRERFGLSPRDYRQRALHDAAEVEAIAA